MSQISWRQNVADQLSDHSGQRTGSGQQARSPRTTTHGVARPCWDLRFLRLVKRADPGWDAVALVGKIERTTCQIR